MQLEKKDEMDLLLFLSTIWDGKWKIIVTTIVTFTIGSVYTSYTPNLYEISSDLSNDNQDVFIKYKSLNDILQEENIFLAVDKSKGFSINGDVILEMFTKEFNDYEEMINVLSTNDFVMDNIKSLDQFSKRKSLVNFANNFKIVTTKDKDLTLKLIFNWHDIDDGITLANRALKLTLKNVRDNLLKDVKSLASSLDSQNKRRITSLQNKLNISREIYKLSTAKRKLILTEQSKIAKELGIEKNNFDFSSPTKTFLPPQQTFEYESQYYLRGFKAIDKEIQLIKERSQEDKDLMAVGYLTVKEQLLLVENDNRPNELRDAANIIVNDDINNWIKFNLEFSEIKNLKKSKLLIIFSIIIGLVIGILGVLLADILKNVRKTVKP